MNTVYIKENPDCCHYDRFSFVMFLVEKNVFYSYSLKRFKLKDHAHAENKQISFQNVSHLINKKNQYCFISHINRLAVKKTKFTSNLKVICTSTQVRRVQLNNFVTKYHCYKNVSGTYRSYPYMLVLMLNPNRCYMCTFP